MPQHLCFCNIGSWAGMNSSSSRHMLATFTSGNSPYHKNASPLRNECSLTLQAKAGVRSRHFLLLHFAVASTNMVRVLLAVVVWASHPRTVLLPQSPPVQPWTDEKSHLSKGFRSCEMKHAKRNCFLNVVHFLYFLFSPTNHVCSRDGMIPSSVLHHLSTLSPTSKSSHKNNFLKV